MDAAEIAKGFPLNMDPQIYSNDHEGESNESIHQEVITGFPS